MVTGEPKLGAAARARWAGKPVALEQWSLLPAGKIVLTRRRRAPIPTVP